MSAVEYDTRGMSHEERQAAYRYAEMIGVEVDDLAHPLLGRVHPAIEQRCEFLESATRMSRWMR